MARRQKGGSPFTDSWFEMPFWILLFLIVVTIILVWHFGLFNKPLTIVNVPGKIEQPTLNIISAEEYGKGELSVKVDYSTSNACSQCMVNLRINDGIQTAFKEYPMGKHTVDLKKTIGYETGAKTVEGYISLNGTAVTSTQSFAVRFTQPSSHKSSGSSGHHPSSSAGPSKKGYTSPSLVSIQ